SDLQEDKEALFDALDTTSACLRVMVKLTAGLELVPERVGAALRGGYLTATEVADYLVSTGMPFRDAHGLVGRLVLEAQSAGKELWELSLDDFRRFSDRFGPDVLEVVTPAGAVAAKRSPGGTAPARVREAMARAREEVAGTRRWLASRPGISPALLRDSGVEHSGGEGP
ncbi:MAG: hypothetical protein HY660_00405, partial [Armatimonadetes bacterium]|nr:hypothetical protein [Armatimonadota bacterium]